jgi:adenosylcobyric acid synthase
MLGREISDPDGIEGPATRVRGLGLLDVTTVMSTQKRITLSDATYDATGDAVTGYEIHLGTTTGPDRANGWLTLDGRSEGAATADGRVKGCYLHGLFTSDAFRNAYMASIGAPVQHVAYDAGVDATLDALADHLETHLDVDTIFRLAQPVPAGDQSNS